MRSGFEVLAQIENLLMVIVIDINIVTGRLRQKGRRCSGGICEHLRGNTGPYRARPPTRAIL